MNSQLSDGWLAKAMREHEEAKQINITIDAIKEAMSPFRPTTISLWIEEGPDDPFQTVYAQIKNLPDVTLKQTLDFEKLGELVEPPALYEYLGAEFARQFLAIARIEPGANIVLGEY